jgi:hypothetical protein
MDTDAGGHIHRLGVDLHESEADHTPGSESRLESTRLPLHEARLTRR